MNKKLIITCIFTVALTIFSSCNRKTIYNYYQHTDAEDWTTGDTLLYNNITPIADKGNYSRVLSLRYTHEYPFANISLIVKQEVWPAGLVTEDTINCRLHKTEDDELTGVAYLNNEFPLPDVHHSEGDSLCIKIYHNMRRKSLQGISDIGIRIEKRF